MVEKSKDFEYKRFSGKVSLESEISNQSLNSIEINNHEYSCISDGTIISNENICKTNINKMMENK